MEEIDSVAESYMDGTIARAIINFLFEKAVHDQNTVEEINNTAYKIHELLENLYSEGQLRAVNIKTRGLAGKVTND